MILILRSGDSDDSLFVSLDVVKVVLRQHSAPVVLELEEPVEEQARTALHLMPEEGRCLAAYPLVYILQKMIRQHVTWLAAAAVLNVP